MNITKRSNGSVMKSSACCQISYKRERGIDESQRPTIFLHFVPSFFFMESRCLSVFCAIITELLCAAECRCVNKINKYR